MERPSRTLTIERTEHSMTDANETEIPRRVTREEAQAYGLPTFNACKPCRKYGHPPERYTSMGGCVACHLMYSRLSGADRKERRLASSTNTYDGVECRRCGGTQRYISSDQCVPCTKVIHQTNSQEQLAIVADLGINISNGKPCRECGETQRYIVGGRCVACIKIRKIAYSRANRAHLTVLAKRRRDANPEPSKAACRRWQRKHPEARRANDQISRARRKGAFGHFTSEDIDNIFRLQKGKCAYCRKPLGKKYHIDHIIPLARRGTNWPRNLQLTHQKCNNQKHAKDPLVYAREIGLLL